MLADVAVGPADDPDLVERDDQLGGLLLEDLEVLTTSLRVVVLDVRSSGASARRPWRRRRGACSRRQSAFERRGGLGEPAGVEEGLAAGVELVGRGLVRVGRLLARGEDLAARPAGPGGAGPARRRWRGSAAGRGTRRAGSRRRRRRRRATGRARSRRSGRRPRPCSGWPATGPSPRRASCRPGGTPRATRKSRSHGGLAARAGRGRPRRAIGHLPPSATWRDRVLERLRVDRDAEARSAAACRRARGRPASRRGGRCTNGRLARSWSGPKSRVKPVRVTA